VPRSSRLGLKSTSRKRRKSPIKVCAVGLDFKIPTLHWCNVVRQCSSIFCCSGTFRKCLRCSWNPPMQLSKCLYCCNRIELVASLSHPRQFRYVSAEPRLKNTVVRSLCMVLTLMQSQNNGAVVKARFLFSVHM